jgi:hypothetical protein
MNNDIGLCCLRILKCFKRLFGTFDLDSLDQVLSQWSPADMDDDSTAPKGHTNILLHLDVLKSLLGKGS